MFEANHRIVEAGAICDLLLAKLEETNCPLVPSSSGIIKRTIHIPLIVPNLSDKGNACHLDRNVWAIACRRLAEALHEPDEMASEDQAGNMMQPCTTNVQYINIVRLTASSISPNAKR